MDGKLKEEPKTKNANRNAQNNTSRILPRRILWHIFRVQILYKFYVHIINTLPTLWHECEDDLGARSRSLSTIANEQSHHSRTKTRLTNRPRTYKIRALTTRGIVLLLLGPNSGRSSRFQERI